MTAAISTSQEPPTQGRIRALRNGRLLRAPVGLTLALLIGAGGLTPPSASAGVYQVSQCALPDGRPTELSTNLSGADNATALDGCAHRTGFQVESPSATLAGTWSQVGVRFDIPASMPNARITRVWEDLSVAGKAAGPGTGGWFGTWDMGAGVVWGDLESFDTAAWAGKSHIILDNAAAGGSRDVDTLISCGLGCSFSSSPTMTLWRAVITIDDSTPPKPATPKPSGLLDGSPQSGTRYLTLDASDADSGVASVDLLTPDGRVVGSVNREASCSFSRPIPCPQSWPDATIPIDTQGLSDGTQTLSLRTHDVAGNTSIASTPAFSINNHQPSRATDAGVPAGSPPGGAVVDREQKMATAHFGAKITITGKFVDSLGQPLGAVPLTVYEQVNRLGDPWQRVAEIMSDAQGGYVYRATASASKTLRFVYQGTRDGQPYSATREVALGVHARMTIGAQRHSISPQGTMRLTGRVGLAELPHGGAWVDLQVRDGSQWRTIDTRRTSAVGGWSYTHRMTRSQNTTFRFRARLRTSGDVAALPSTSPVTRVHVR